MTGTVNEASNASPIVITSPSHNLSDGAINVAVLGVNGNLAANGIHSIAVVDEDHFSLDDTTGSGDMTTSTAIWDWSFDGPQPNIADVSIVSDDFQVTTPVDHGLATDDWVGIGNHPTPSVNGTWHITVVDARNFMLNAAPQVVVATGAHGIWWKTIAP